MGLNRYNKYYIKTSCKSIEMKLTTFTESALGTLVYLGRHHHRMVTIDEIFAQHAASRSLLTKVIQQLGIDGWIIATRGCKGGLRLAHEPHNIALGAVVRDNEPNFHMAECFHSESNACRISSDCLLKGVLGGATEAFLAVLDALTLADLLLDGQPRRGDSATGPALPARPAPTG